MPLSMDEYQNELTEAGDQAKKLLASQPAAVIDENALVYKKDDAVLAKGKAVFITSCVPCHRNDGGGNAIGQSPALASWWPKRRRVASRAVPKRPSAET